MPDDAVHSLNPTLPAAFFEANMAAVVEVLQDLIVVLTPIRDASGVVRDFEFTEVTGPAERLASVTPGALIGTTLSVRLNAQSLALLLPACVMGIETGEPVTVDALRYEHAEEGERYFDVRGRRIGDTLACTWRDVSTRHALLERYQEVVEHSADVVYQAGSDGIITWISPVVTELLGYQPADLIGTTVRAHCHPDEVAKLDMAIEALSRGEVSDPEIRLRARDGDYHWTRVRVRLIAGELGVVVGRVGSFHDIQDEMETRQELIESEARYRILMENESDIVFRTRLDTSIEWVSPSVGSLTGWATDQIVGHRVAEFVAPEDRAALAVVVLDVIGGNAASFQGRLVTADGGFRWIAVRARPIFSDKGETVGSVINVRDVHDEVLAREALGESEQRFRLALESAPVGMSVVGLDHRFIEANPALAELVDRDEAWLLGRHLTDVLDTDLETLDEFLETEVNARHAKRTALERRLIRPDDAEVWVEFSAGIVRDPSGVPLSYVASFVDVTSTKAAREELSYLATHDVLTHLINRRDLYDRIDEVMSHTRRSGTNLGALFIDVDNLKVINDTHGHAIGDQALVGLANRLTSAGRSDDIVSRIGGDEFVILLPWLHSTQDAEHVAQRILHSLEAPIHTDLAEIQVQVSIGIALANPAEDAHEILRNADAALYRAKRSGRAQAATYDPALDRDFDVGPAPPT